MKHKYKNIEFYHPGNFRKIKQLEKLPSAFVNKMERMTKFFPFKTNNYVVNELIDWGNAIDDPMFRLNFPHPDMMLPKHQRQLAGLWKGDPEELKKAIYEIRMSLNPHPAGQNDNVPTFDKEKVRGVQHKYNETVLVFPSQGQTCHAYCTFCFRWPQFIGINDLKFATDESRLYQDYIREHREITDILFTGGDPMVMSAKLLKEYIEPFLGSEFDHIRAIRIGSKSLAYWPMRYISDGDTPEILKLFEKVVKAGKHLAFQAHISHPAELKTPQALRAIKNIHSTGAIIRSQSPIMNHINNSAEIWHEMMNLQYNLGIVPYYMFIARNTGAHHYFAVTLADAYKIYSQVIRTVSGLCKTIRGPSMSTRQGKVRIDGVTRISGKKVFILSYLEARNPDWINRPFFARYCKEATWLDELEPVFDEDNFYFENKPVLIREKKTR
jgi:KamA family protein